MKILATSLSTGVSLTLVGEPVAWRFDHWARSSDERRLPPLPAHSIALTFTMPGEAGSDFEALCAADQSARQRIGVECEPDLLVAVASAPGVSPTDRWEVARFKVKSSHPAVAGITLR